MAGQKRQSERTLRFVRRALRTNADMTTIARRAGLKSSAVYYLNYRLGIRSPEETKRIASATISALKKHKERKIGYFTPEQKERLIKQNRKRFMGIAAQWWNGNGKWFAPIDYASALRAETNSVENLASEIASFAFEKLDYYDPEFRGKDGRKASVSTFIHNNANFFCQLLVGRILNRKRFERTRRLETQGENGVTPGRETAVRPMAESARQLRVGGEIPNGTKYFLRAIGVRWRTLAPGDFAGMREELLRVAEERETGLSPRELEIVKARLQGKTLEQTGSHYSARPLNRETMRLSQKSAIRKIVERLRQKSQRT